MNCYTSKRHQLDCTGNESYIRYGTFINTSKLKRLYSLRNIHDYIIICMSRNFNLITNIFQIFDGETLRKTRICRVPGSLPCARQKAHSKEIINRVLLLGTRQSHTLPCVFSITRQSHALPCVLFRHTAKYKKNFFSPRNFFYSSHIIYATPCQNLVCFCVYSLYLTN